MRVSLYVQISLKDRPPGYLGLRGESLAIGKDEPADLAPVIVGLIRRIGDYYGLFETPEKLNEQLDKIADYCRAARFREGRE